MKNTETLASGNPVATASGMGGEEEERIQSARYKKRKPHLARFASVAVAGWQKTKH
jgi:hypothetical protein